MQYILTQEEYDELLAKSNSTDKQAINILRQTNRQLTIELKESRDAYTKLLIFGVSANNESAKDSKCKANS